MLSSSSLFSHTFLSFLRSSVQQTLWSDLSLVLLVPLLVLTFSSPFLLTRYPDTRLGINYAPCALVGIPCLVPVFAGIVNPRSSSATVPFVRPSSHPPSILPSKDSLDHCFVGKFLISKGIRKESSWLLPKNLKPCRVTLICQYRK